MFCAECGKELTEGAARCPGCGTPTGQTVKRQKTIARIFLFCSIGLFLASLTQPAFYTRNEPAFGIMLLLVGWLGVLARVPVAISWLANPLLLMSWITFPFPKISFWFSLLAVIFSASFLLCTQIIVDGGGSYIPIGDRLPGYWLWLFSTIVMLANNGIQLYNKRRRHHGTE